MDALLKSVQERIEAKVTALKYIDEDWGQLDYYSQNPPVKYPCCLFDIGEVSWTNQGKKQQSGIATILVTIANLKLTNTSSKAPAAQRNAAWSIHSEILKPIHQALHGFAPIPSAGLLYRKRTQRVKRNDGIQEYLITYQCTVVGDYDTSGDVVVRDDFGMGIERPPFPEDIIG